MYNGQLNFSNLHNRCAIVRNGLLAVCIDHQQVTAIWPQRASYGILHCETCLDIRYYLALSLGRICTFLQDYDCWSLSSETHDGALLLGGPRAGCKLIGATVLLGQLCPGLVV